MRVISIGNDPKLFETGSAVQKRQIEYGTLCTELHVFSRTGGSASVQLSSNVWVHPFSFSNLKTIKELLSNKEKETMITTQDPFEHGLVGVWLKLWHRVPLQIQLHTDFLNRHFLFSSSLNFIRFLLAQITLPYADSVRVVSERVRKSVEQFNLRITVLPIWVPSLEIEKIVERNPFSILTVARLEKEKDIETALKAFDLINERYPQATFTIAGEGTEKEKLVQLVKSRNLEDRVKFIGWQEDKARLYAEHSIYISTSLFEGYGMSIVEAAKAGCALVLSDAGVAGELFIDKESAFVCPQGNEEAFAEALHLLLGDPALVQRMGEKAQKAAEHASISHDAYLSQYQKALESASTIQTGNFVSSLLRGNKILRFLIGGCTAAFTQIFFLYFFTDIVGLWYLLSSTFAFVIALVISFLLQKLWVFQDTTKQGVHTQFAKYFVIAIFGLFLNTIGMYAFVSLLGLWYIVAQFIMGLIIAVINYFSYKRFIFK